MIVNISSMVLAVMQLHDLSGYDRLQAVVVIWQVWQAVGVPATCMDTVLSLGSCLVILEPNKVMLETRINEPTNQEQS
jgi:hypothetical protein